MDPAKTDILLVSTADWDNPYWTNKQHVAVELNARGHRVFYIESQGLRRPTATMRDLGRMWRRLKRGFAAPRQVRQNLWVWSPLSAPFQGLRLVRWMNGLFVKTAVGLWTRALGLTPRILWTYSPMTTEFYDLSVYPLTVYHAVDDIKTQPGMPRAAIAEAEKKLAEAVDIIFTTAPNLQDQLSLLNGNTHYFPNVADYSHFSRALGPDLALPDDLADVAGPRIGFVGAVSSYKLDMALIAEVARAQPDWSFVFIGEIGEGDPLTEVDDLAKTPNIVFMGGRPYDSLPGYLKGFDVAIIPSLLNEYTKSMFPMKFFEYLAAGRQVVSTRLAALEAFSRFVHMADNAQQFRAAIHRALAGEGASLEERLALAREHTYAVRTEKMMAIVQRDLAVKHPA
jgi:glycosyltransferase involved in cell wall biosynthesis